MITLTYKNGKDYITIASYSLDEKKKKPKGYVCKTAQEAEKKNPNLHPNLRDAVIKKLAKLD
ncbi:hypothetical protein LQV63_22520 [Paenibacillus profundus]|uniref:Phage protein n=1 Tax=Paenibacillus profundus TaxID=1173085 RepID=A0ABS8YJU0_9BACL|nr:MULTISPECIES: hypothetical protein [Paenibacillus]MCE5172061.1 hypothetical protein [Paenibacillus profundus]MCM3338015.1 hypothetical protein [Paenibacillus sp. MER TA 81-3]